MVPCLDQWLKNTLLQFLEKIEILTVLVAFDLRTNDKTDIFLSLINLISAMAKPIRGINVKKPPL